MNVKLNGSKVEVDEGTTLQGLLERQGVQPSGIATALNSEVVPASKRAETLLKEGDSIIIIQPFCGG